MTYEELKTKAISIVYDCQNKKRMLDDFKAKIQADSDKYNSLQEQKIVLESALVVMKEIVDEMSSSQIKQVVSLVSYALKTIFFDRDYTLDYEMDDKRSCRTIEFYLVEKLDGKVIRSSFSDGIGGGILAIVGFVLQVYYLFYYKQAPIMFCDESFSQVSDQYIEPLMQFIQELAKEKNFHVVLISHDPRLIQRADAVYEVDKGVVTKVK